MSPRAVSLHRSALLLAILVASILGAQPAMAGLTLPHHTLPPSAVDPSLASLDPEFRAVADVYTADAPRYDEFFMRAAKLHAVFLLSDSVSGRFGAALATAANGMFEVPRNDPGQWGALLDQLDGRRGEVSAAALSALAMRGAELAAIDAALPRAGADLGAAITSAGELTSSADQDFRGFSGKWKLVRTVWTLRHVAADLVGDEKRAAQTVAFTHSLGIAFARHFGSSTAVAASNSAAVAPTVPASSDDPFAPSSEVAAGGDSIANDAATVIQMPDPDAGSAEEADSPATDGSHSAAYQPNLECAHLSAMTGARTSLTCRVTRPDGSPASGVVIEFATSEGVGRTPIGRRTSDVRGIAGMPWFAQATFGARQASRKVYYYASALPSAKVLPANGSGDVLVSK
jgi:hypothetical protein